MLKSIETQFAIQPWFGVSKLKSKHAMCACLVGRHQIDLGGSQNQVAHSVMFGQSFCFR